MIFKKVIFSLLVISTLFVESIKGQVVKTFSDFKWTVTIPEGLLPMNVESWNELKSKGQATIENTFDEDLENQAITIFVYQSGQGNTYEANWQSFDSKIDGDYLESVKKVNEILYKTFKTQLPATVKLDSTSSVQNVSGLDFQRFDLNIVLSEKLTLKTIGFSRLFDDKEFTVNITYLDEKIGQKLLESFLNSKFQ